MIQPSPATQLPKHSFTPASISRDSADPEFSQQGTANTQCNSIFSTSQQPPHLLSETIEQSLFYKAKIIKEALVNLRRRNTPWFLANFYISLK
jgi:hypothetical protein